MKNKKTEKRKHQGDPYANREAKRYENPIVSREYILEALKNDGGPMTIDELKNEFNLQQPDQHEALRRRLSAMVRDGQVIVNRLNGYCLVNKKDLICGRVIANPDGFGFLKPDDGNEDFFLSSRQMRMLSHGDRAVVRIVGIDRRGRKQAAVVEVVERNTQQVVGSFFQESGISYVMPENKRIIHNILIPSDQFNNAIHGQIVVAEILSQPSIKSQPVGRVMEIVGDHMAPGMETDIAIRSYGIPHLWNDQLLDELDSFSTEISAQELAQREDLRALPFVTIDGEDARDFDDAVYCEKCNNGWRLLVAIADVAAYVKTGTALDNQAIERGNSVYFPDRVVPMLPEKLSNGLCSLIPNEEKLTLVCEMLINAEGKISRSRFVNAVIISKARLTYTLVASHFSESTQEINQKYPLILNNLKDLYSVYKILMMSRKARGAIEFNTTETRLVFGDQGGIERIIPVIRNDAHRLIEECMISANVAAARLLKRKKIDIIYRVHEGPSKEKLNALRIFLSELGVDLPGGNKPDPMDYTRLLEQIKTRADRRLIEKVLLRSLSQAVYSPALSGHFGLALPSYTHFTSPIRRYPDTIVHRAIKHIIAGKNKEDFYLSAAELISAGEHCSTTERRADEATRDALDWLKCEYMMNQIGGTFSGIVTTVTSFGLFIELDDIYVEGLLHITALPKDYFHFDPVRHRLVGERTKRTFRLADPIRVKLDRVDLDERKIDFVLTEPDDTLEKPKKRKKRKKKNINK